MSIARDGIRVVKPPFSPPDCPWVPMEPGTPVPKKAVYLNGTLDRNRVYIGRVYDGNCIFVGTAVPDKGVCLYLNKNLEVKSSPNYEILTVSCGDPLWFLEMEVDHKQAFISGIKENRELLYAGRYVDTRHNTYYGWVNKATRSIYIPREASLGQQVLDRDFGVLVHRFLHRLCVCPP